MAEKRDSTDVAEAEEKVSEKHPKLDEPDDEDKPQDDNEEESDDDIYDNGAGYVDENIFGKYECKLSSIVIHIPAFLVVFELVLRRKNFAFELLFCLANAGFFTLSSKHVA